MRLCAVAGELTIKRVGEIHGVEVPGRGGLYEQEDVPSDRSCRSRRFSMIAEVSLRTLVAMELRIPPTSLHVEKNASLCHESKRGSRHQTVRNLPVPISISIHVVARTMSFWTTSARVVPLTQKEVAVSAKDIKPQARKTSRLSLRLATPNSGSTLLTPVSNHAAIQR